MKQVLTLLGPSAQLHVETSQIAHLIGGDTVVGFTVTAQYDVPPISLTMTAEGPTLEYACSKITWQFLEQIGMPTV